jgi:hypothetical protein
LTDLILNFFMKKTFFVFAFASMAFLSGCKKQEDPPTPVDPVVEDMLRNNLAFRAGGTGGDFGTGIAVDKNGNIYVTGYFEGTATFGEKSLTSKGKKDAFVAKYNPEGGLVWVQTQAGTGDDQGRGVAIDAKGDVFMTGNFEGTAVFNEISLVSTGSADAFIAKYSSEGALQWVQKGGGASFEYPQNLAVDNEGSVVVVGGFYGTTTFGGSTQGSTSSGDIFLVKYSSSGAFQWLQVAGGTTNSDAGTDLDVDENGNVYVTGYFTVAANFSGTRVNAEYARDIFVAKYSGAGAIQWVRRAGGAGDDTGRGIAVDGSGNVYITGEYSANLPSTIVGADVTFGTIKPTSLNDSKDLFVAKLDNSGVFQWVQVGGSKFDDQGWDIITDANGDVFVIVYFQDAFKIDNQTLVSKGSDILIARYNSSGALQSVRQEGGEGSDIPLRIALSKSGNLFATGIFYNSTSIAGKSLVSAGAEDVFIARFKW